MNQSGKTRFLIVDDYGMGGIWGCVWARSATEAAQRFRNSRVSGAHPRPRPVGQPRGGEVVVFSERPDWMSADREADIAAKRTFDIDHLEESDYFARFLRDSN